MTRFMSTTAAASATAAAAARGVNGAAVARASARERAPRVGGGRYNDPRAVRRRSPASATASMMVTKSKISVRLFLLRRKTTTYDSLLVEKNIGYRFLPTTAPRKKNCGTNRVINRKCLQSSATEQTNTRKIDLSAWITKLPPFS